MTTQTAKTFTVLSCVVFMLLAGTSTHVFTIPVFDVANFIDAGKRLVELKNQLRELKIQSEQLILEYEHFVFQALPLPGLPELRVPRTPWIISETADTYGTSGGWITAINLGVDIGAVYEHAVEPLRPYETILDEIPDGQLARTLAVYGTVELADAANRQAMTVLGLQRAKAEDTVEAIAALEAASLSTEAELNTQTAVLQKINAASMMELQGRQDTNQLLVALLEQQLVAAKRQRDAEAAAISDRMAFYAAARETLDHAPHGAGTTEFLTTFRIP